MTQEEFNLGDPNLKGMIRAGDYDTSKAAAISVLPKLSRLKKDILAYFQAFGSHTDEEMSDRFSDRKLAESTVRKRRGELVQAGLVEDSGLKRKNRGGSDMEIWRLK